METIIIHESDFDIDNEATIDDFNDKLFHIKEPFEVKFDYKIKTIPSLFFYRTNLAKITLPNSIVLIDDNAFEDCTSLAQITLPNSIEALGHKIFNYCFSLQQVIIQQSKEDFLSNVKGALDFFDEYEKLITFEESKSLDSLLSKTNSIEQIITDLELEH